jgi:hypothetical protein
LLTYPDFLVIGHITKDLLADGQFTIGGTVTYSSLTACNLGRETGIITRADPALDLSCFAACGITVHRLPSPVTTTFENIYLDGTRYQYIRAVATPIVPADVPAAWRAAPIVHLGPLAQELASDMVGLFDQALIGVTPQGWMRCWDGTGLVRPVPWAGVEDILARADVLVFSEHDVARDVATIHRYARLARIMVVTQGRHGCTVYVRGERPRHFPAFPAHEVEPTGAGDVFAAAFLIKLQATGDPYQAARYANCVASFVVEAPGTTGLPTPEQVAERLARGHGDGFVGARHSGEVV